MVAFTRSNQPRERLNPIDRAVTFKNQMNQPIFPPPMDGAQTAYQNQFQGYIPNIDELLTPGLANTCRIMNCHLQTPEPMVLTMLLAAVSSVVMLRHLVESGPGLTSPAGLSTLLLAEINERKSAADTVIRKPLQTWAESQRLAFQSEITKWKQDTLIYKAKLKGLSSALSKASRNGADCTELEEQLSKLVDDAPKEPHLFETEVRTGTIEGVIQTVVKQGSVFWNASEGGAGLDSRISQAAPVLSDLWSAMPPAHVTKSGGLQTSKYALFAAIIAVQPALFKKFLTTPKGRRWIDSGLLSRFLVVYAESTQGFRNIPFSDSGPLNLSSYEARMIELLDMACAERGKPLQTIRLSPDALYRLQSFRLNIERELRPGGAFAGTNVKGAAGKMPENAARLAAGMHVFEGYPGVINGETMRRAINLAEKYLQEHLRLFDQEVTPLRIEMTARSIMRTIGRHLTPLGPNFGYSLNSLSNRGNDDVRDKQMRALALQLCFQNQNIYYANVPGQSGTHIFLTPSGWAWAQQLLHTLDGPIL